MDEPSEYADMAQMIRHLRTLDEESVRYRRQRDAIVERCLPLAEHIARRYRNRGEPLDDLIQTACMGLVHAVNRFDTDNGADFLAFAVPTVAGEVRRHFRDRGWAVKVPRRVKDLQGQLNNARSELSQQLVRAPNATEIAEHLGIDRDLVIDATFAGSNYSVLSTYSASGSDDAFPNLADRLGEIDAGIDKVLQVETVRPLIAALSERQRTVLTLRFFEDMTQTEIANRIGCSQMHVSRLLANALDTLRRQVRQSELAAISEPA